MNTRLSMRAHSGFTLIEIMVVLVVLGVVASLVVLNIGSGDRARAHQQYLSEIENFVLEAYTTARLSQRDYALHWFHDEVVLYSLSVSSNEQGESVVALEHVNSWQLPDTLEFQLEFDDQRLMLPAYTGDDPDPDQLQIMILPDGHGDNPWTLELVWRADGERWQRLVSDGFNRPQWRVGNE